MTALDAIVFLLVVGEEVGWRGFALPRLTQRVGPVGASVLIGVCWAIWHLPLFHMPVMPQYGAPVLPYFAYTIALSFLLSGLTLGTGGSVVVATVFHGAVNALGVVSIGTAPELRGWTNALSYGLVALAGVVVVWRYRSEERKFR